MARLLMCRNIKMSSNWLRIALSKFARERETMYKMTIQLGFEDGEVTIETDNYNVIEQLNEFVQYQQAEGWEADWVGVSDYEFDEEEADEEEAE